MSVAVPRRAPAERALVEYLRADAWRFDDVADREANLTRCIASNSGQFSPFELNVLYEMIALTQSVDALMGFLRKQEGLTGNQIPSWLGDSALYAKAEAQADPDVAELPMQLLVAVAVLVEPDSTDFAFDHDRVVARGTVDAWRKLTKRLREKYRPWANPEAVPMLTELATHRVMVRDHSPGRSGLLRPTIALAVEALLRITWLFECEQMDALAFGPVSDRRLPTDPAKATVALRRYCEQQPELRKVPAFVHVAPRDPDGWMRPREYAKMAFPPIDPDQTRAVGIDALMNRRFLLDHVAIVEVDRKPIKKLVLAPEVHDKRYGVTYLNCLVEHDKGWFAAEVLIGGEPDAPLFALALPFGAHAWRALPDRVAARQAGGDSAELPPDQSIIGVVIAAFRDLIVANVREQHYDSTVERGDDAKSARRAARKSKRGHVKVVRYLPRTVVIRREEQAERLERTGSTRRMTRAYRVGAFAKVLREGTRRSPEAAEFADEIGMPLRDDQTIVRPHIRGGTEAEREALLAQDDVRLWRSWAAVDLVFATRSRGAVE